jgi:hypothetical protein
MRSRLIAVLASSLLAGLVLAVPAQATFPGENGRIIFERIGDQRVWTVNPDGSALTPLGGCEGPSGPDSQFDPAWSPDGKRVLYDCGASVGAIHVINVDGSGDQFYYDNGATTTGIGWSPDGERFVHGYTHCEAVCHQSVETGPAPDGSGSFMPLASDLLEPDWSPDGARIALWSSAERDIYTIDPNGTGLVNVTNSPGVFEQPASWAPDSSKLVFTKPDGAGWRQVFTMRRDGTAVTQVTSSEQDKAIPVWSPDGTRIAFFAVDGSSSELYTMRADGGDVVRVTTTSDASGTLGWQPIPVNAYPRPKGASPIKLTLVPAYEPCTAPNRTHGPPLAFPSCAPPVRTPGALTIGTADSNGMPTKSVSRVAIGVRRGNPSTSADEADLRLHGTVNDVRLASDLSDYTGELTARITVRITDKDNTPHPGGPGPATTQDLTYSFPIPCAATSDTTVGGDCTFETTAEAFVPGLVKEQQRSIWELGSLRVHDGAGNVFMTQGVFVP